MHSNLSSTAITKALWIMVVAWAALLIAFWLPDINLATSFSVSLYWLTSTGDVMGIVLIGLAFVGLLIFHTTLPWRRRLQEVFIHIVVLALLQGGGALVNEYLVKPSLATPRPNIVRLAEQDALAMTPEHFYSSMDRHKRGIYLEQVLANPSFDAIALRAEVRDHWIHETGYSMPSGHAFSAMLSATYFLAMGIALVTSRRRWIFYLLPGWAVLVAWSRVLLGVHCPGDVVLGGLMGILLGAAAIWVADRLLGRLKTPTRIDEL